MATSVKMDERTKSRLEELQAEIKLQTGKKVTQQALLERLVDGAFESKSAFIESFREQKLPLSTEEKERFFLETSDWGIETTEEEIDQILYGEPE